MRFLRKRRELELRDLGGLIFDMYRFGSKRQDLVRDKLQDMFSADRELREFEHLLGRRQRRLDLREAGVGGACPRCQQLFSTEARFCSRCGESLADGARRDVVVGTQTVPREGPSVYEPRTAPAAEAAGWAGAEPGTHAWPQPEPEAVEPAPDGVEPQHEAAEGPAEQPSRWPPPHGEPGRQPDGPEPQTHTWPQPQWPEPELQPQASWGHTRAAPRPAPMPSADTGGRRSPFRRRRRKSPAPGAHAAEEARRQNESWEAQYQASVEAQRRAWAAETQAQHPGGGGAGPGANAEHQDAAGSGEGASALESGDPLASRYPDPPR